MCIWMLILGMGYSFNFLNIYIFTWCTCFFLVAMISSEFNSKYLFAYVDTGIIMWKLIVFLCEFGLCRWCLLCSASHHINIDQF